MVKLTTPDDKGTAFYFNTVEECEEFCYVFKDHWCNIKWNSPEVAEDFSEMPESDRRALHGERDPRRYAENNLSWGHFLANQKGRDLTDEQCEMLSKFICEFSVPPEQLDEEKIISATLAKIEI